jgi:hypothetical protein
MEEFYVGKKGAVYLRQENGSLARFGLRVAPHGTLEVFDHLRRTWHRLPAHIPDRSGGVVTLSVTREDK